jgi:phosphotransferase system HPr (HPr) family protein
MKRIIEEIQITDPLGIHARPAASLALAVRKSGARVTLRCGANSADATSVVRLLGLGAGPRSTVTAEIEGEDEAVASALAALRASLCPEAGDAI